MNRWDDLVWQVTLALLGEIAPALAVVSHREELLSADEFVDVADHVINALALFLLGEDAPAVGVFCMNATSETAPETVA